MRFPKEKLDEQSLARLLLPRLAVSTEETSKSKMYHPILQEMAYPTEDSPQGSCVEEGHGCSEQAPKHSQVEAL